MAAMFNFSLGESLPGTTLAVLAFVAAQPAASVPVVAQAKNARREIIPLMEVLLFGRTPHRHGQRTPTTQHSQAARPP